MLKHHLEHQDDEPELSFEIEFIDGKVKLEQNELLGGRERIRRAYNIIGKAIWERGALDGLPKDHPWEKAKWEHADAAAEENDTIYSFLKEKLPDNYYALLTFLATFHDLGRTIEGKRKLGLLPPGYREFSHHGEESFSLLKEWGALEPFPPETREIIEYAIIHHADKSTPPLPDNPTNLDKQKYFYTCTLRDVDKLALFRNKTDRYLFDVKVKAAQAKVNNLLGEQNIINPSAIIETFGEFQAIKRGECVSYEAFMLQYLAWIFDIKLRPVLEEVVRVGAIEKILRYFREQRIPDDQYQRIKETIMNYLARFGLELAIKEN